MESVQGLNGEICPMFDDDKCWKTIKTADDTYNYFKNNFVRHYASGSSPFPIHGHARNIDGAFNTGRREGNK